MIRPPECPETLEARREVHGLDGPAGVALQVALALYLSPVILMVLVIGGVCLLFQAMARAAVVANHRLSSWAVATPRILVRGRDRSGAASASKRRGFRSGF